jgi:hypothetical protein
VLIVVRRLCYTERTDQTWTGVAVMPVFSPGAEVVRSSLM